jgi:uncharacterized membrane protein
VLFYSPTCPHCHEVIQNHLPIFFGVYGGEPSVWVDQTVPPADLSLYLMYNEQLEILLVDATRPLGSRLFVAELESRGIPPSRGTVPRMVFGDEVLIGGAEIPARFHPLMQQAQNDGGLDWPAIPGLAELTPAFPTAQTAAADSAAVDPAEAADSTAPGVADTVMTPGDSIAPAPVTSEPTDTADVTAPMVTPDATAEDTATVDTPTTTPTGDTPVGALGDSADAVAPTADSALSPFDVVPGRSPTMAEKLRRDPLGNAIAIVVLLAMIASVVMIATTERFQQVWPKPPVVILLIAGLGIVVAGYLTYVETSGVEAVCGPVGDCNTVQQSEYATLFGFLPVGLLGLAGYVSIIVAWFVWTARSTTASYYAVLSISGIALVGTLFSIYLTFLEPFVIGATCAWCIVSSVAITALLWLAAGSGKAAWARIRS